MYEVLLLSNSPFKAACVSAINIFVFYSVMEIITEYSRPITRTKFDINKFDINFTPRGISFTDISFNSTHLTLIKSRKYINLSKLVWQN